MRVDDGGEFLLLEFFDGVLVVSQVQLGAHQDDRRVGAVVSHLRVPLGKRRGRQSQKRLDTDGQHGKFFLKFKKFATFPK